MKRLVLLIPLAFSALFCTLTNSPGSQDAPVPDAVTQAQSDIAASPSPTSTTSAVPSLVWLPFGHASEWHDNQVLTVRNGKGSFEQTPVNIGVFWDYTALTGRLAYASETNINHPGTRSGELAVSDLWVYDYQTNKAEMWQPNDVVIAKWSPAADPKTSKQSLAALLYNTTLVLMTGPNETTLLSDTASPRFSWSPDGRYIAYFNDTGIFVVTIEGGQIKQIPNVAPGFGGWNGAIWATDQQALIYPQTPIEIAALDGSRVFTPHTADGQSPVTGPAFNVLWSPEKRILAFDVDDLNTPSMWIYELSPDLETIISSFSFDTVQGDPIAAWWVPGESILLRTGEIWSISEKKIVDSIH